VGVPAAERARPQRLLLTIEMSCDLANAARSDDLKQTIDYGAVCRRLLRFGARRSWQLIETLANEIGAMIQREFGAEVVTVEVKKFIIPSARYVAVQITRGR